MDSVGRSLRKASLMSQRPANLSGLITGVPLQAYTNRTKQKSVRAVPCIRFISKGWIFAAKVLNFYEKNSIGRDCERKGDNWTHFLCLELKLKKLPGFYTQKLFCFCNTGEPRTYAYLSSFTVKEKLANSHAKSTTPLSLISNFKRSTDSLFLPGFKLIRSTSASFL